RRERSKRGVRGSRISTVSHASILIVNISFPAHSFFADITAHAALFRTPPPRESIPTIGTAIAILPSESPRMDSRPVKGGVMKFANPLPCSALLLPCVARAENAARLEAPRNIDLGIIDVLKADGRYKILVSALETTGVAKTMDIGGPYTFFAPTDEAFQRVPK